MLLANKENKIKFEFYFCLFLNCLSSKTLAGFFECRRPSAEEI